VMRTVTNFRVAALSATVTWRTNKATDSFTLTVYALAESESKEIAWSQLAVCCR
jgi:hypothetical protein